MFIDNINLLRERFPEVRKYFLEHEKEIQTNLIEIKQSKCRVPTARYQLDDRELMVHSAYDPVREANRIVKSHAEQLTSDTHVMFFGLGLGYHIEAFNQQYPELTYSIYEPLPEMFLSMANNIHMTKLFSDKLVNLYVDQVDQLNMSYLKEFQSENRGIHIIVLPSYENIAKEKKEQFFTFIKESVQNRRTELHTNGAFQKLWVMNSVKNFSEVLSTPNIMRDFDNEKFKDKPAVIVSAGPSLVEDIEYIRYIKDNELAYVFSVGSAINSLLSYDILPDAVFTYDPSVNNCLVFKKMIEMGIESIPMVFGSSVGYKTLEHYNGPKAHFITTQDRTSLFFLRDQLDLERDIIADSPSIAVMTFQILNKLGVNPIIFAGQNLGFLHGRQYSEGIEYEHVNSEVEQEQLENALTTKDVFGNEIKTNYGFNNMRRSIENLAVYYKGNIFINTTKGGAAIEGIPFMPIEEVIEKVLIKKVKGNSWWVVGNQYETENIGERYRSLEKSKNALNLKIDKLPSVHILLSLSVETKNKGKAEQALIQFDEIYNATLDNEFFREFLAFYLRVTQKFMAVEIAQLNQEKDIFKKADRMNMLIGNFINQLKQGMQELHEHFEESYLIRML